MSGQAGQSEEKYPKPSADADAGADEQEVDPTGGDNDILFSYIYQQRTIDFALVINRYELPFIDIKLEPQEPYNLIIPTITNNTGQLIIPKEDKSVAQPELSLSKYLKPKFLQLLKELSEAHEPENDDIA